MTNRALKVVQKLVRKISNGGTLKRDELRAGDLATQALRSCIADPSNAHRVELLIQEAERLAPDTMEPRRDSRPAAPSARHRSGRPGARKQTGHRPKSRPAAKKKTAKVTIKKKPPGVVRKP